MIDDERLGVDPIGAATAPSREYVFTELSTRYGGSPSFYWDPNGVFLMLDNWTQIELDEFAWFHGMTHVVPLELDQDQANGLINTANARTIRNTVPLPSTS